MDRIQQNHHPRTLCTKKVHVECNIQYTMTPELTIVINEKHQQVAQVVDEVESVPPVALPEPRQVQAVNTFDQIVG